MSEAESERAAFSHAAHMFKVLGNPTRLRILHELSDLQRTVCQLTEAVGVSQPLVSQYLRLLREAGLVRAQRMGREVHYFLADAHVEHLVRDALAHSREENMSKSDTHSG